MVGTGRAKKIRRMLEFEGIPENQFNQAYKNVKKAKYRKDGDIPTKILKTKRHKGEDIENFKERRRKTNKRKREKRR